MAGSVDESGLWIRRFQPVPDPVVRLLCLPHAGGSASFYFETAQRLAPSCEVLAVQYPGRQDRRTEKCIDRLPDLADAVTAQLSGWLDRPLGIFGHSMGATLGFEIARRLEERGVDLVALFASGRRAPSRQRAEAVHLKDDDGLLAELRGLGGTSLAALTSPEILRMSLPALRGDYTAVETYRYVDGPPLRSAIHMHTGLGDPKVTLDEADDWRRHTSGPFELRTYPGGHFYLVENAAELTGSIRAVLLAAST